MRDTLTRRRVLIRVLMTVGLVAAGCSDKPTPPTSPTRPAGSPAAITLSALTITGPDSVPPGAQAQYRASARYSDSTTSDVTATAVWASSRTPVLAIEPDGTALGGERGSATLSATFASVEQRLTVRVLEPGTFVVGGTVVQAGGGYPISGATVTVDSGPGLGRTATTDGSGTFEFYGLAGSVQLTVSAAEYQSRGVNIAVTRDTTAHVLLNAVLGGLKDVFRFTVTGPDRLEIGASAQYRAMLHYMDGRTEDVTTGATWTTTNAFGAPTMTINASGIAVGIADGPSMVNASLQSFAGFKHAMVLRPGTFTLAGTVRGSGGEFLHGATVTVESGLGAGKTVYNYDWDLGYYIFGVGGSVRLRAAHPGYESRTVDLNVTKDDAYHFTLTPIAAARRD